MIKDEDFIQSDSVPGPTKEEVRCLVMCKSQISHKDVVMDVGCGTGGLTVESARRAKKVISIDKNPEAVDLTRQNLDKFGLDKKIDLFEGDALDVMQKVGAIDVLLVGGSSGDLKEIVEVGLSKLQSNGRIVVTSILLETRVQAVEIFKNLGMVPDVVEVSISKGKITDRGTMMLARNPIAIVSATKPSF